MSLPVTVPFTFGNATTTQSLSSLDTNFTTITNSVNGLTNGASQINVASISATGTANATTYLRGDGAWATVSGGGGSGTVTSINANSSIGFTFTGGPVTSSGTLTLSGPTPGTSGNVLTSNGTAWVSQAAGGGSSGNQFQNQLITSTTTWTAPSGVTQARVTVIGAGGGGGGGCGAGCPTLNGGSGGSGGFAFGMVTVTPATVYTVTVGTGGTGGIGSAAGTGANGTAGTSSSFGALISATGGAFGVGSSIGVQGANGASGTGASGTIRNYNVLNLNMFFLGGNAQASLTTGAGAPIAFSASGTYRAGCGGTGGSPTTGTQFYGAGGVNGIVMIEWVG